MAEDERKYEILPGVKLPDYKTLKEASSDFNDTGVEDVTIRSTGYVTDSSGVPDRATLEEIKRLQELGDEVAENEQRASEESRKKMQTIMQTAVTRSASIDDLKKSAIQQASEEKLAEIEKRNQEEEARIAAEEEKKRMREERRAMQRKQLEDAKARAAAASEAEAAATEAEAEANEAEEADNESGNEAVIESIGDAVAAGAAAGIDIISGAVEEGDSRFDEPVRLEGSVALDESVIEEIKGNDTEEIQEPDIIEQQIEPQVDIDATGVISTDEETFEDFGEFLDDDNKK